MNKEYELFKYAKMVNWKPSNIPELISPEIDKEHTPFIKSINDHLSQEAQNGQLLLPYLKSSKIESIGIYSDYGGEHKESNFFSYSFLICAYEDRIAFPVKMKEIRKKYKLGNREISFKKFDSVALRNSLPEYLKTADELVIGLLFTVVVSKRIETLFGIDNNHLKDLTDLLFENNLGKWKPKVAEKLLRITHIVAYLIGLLCRSEQKIFWMTDHDAIAPNNPQQNYRINLLRRVQYLYSQNHFNLIGGAVPFKEKSIPQLDFLSLTDITAGSIEHYFSNSDRNGINQFMKKGADEVLAWHSRDGLSLKKKAFLIDMDDQNNIYVKYLKFIDNDPPKNIKYIPI